MTSGDIILDVINADSDLKVNPSLQAPYALLPLLFNGSHCDFFVFTHDLDRRITYMGANIRTICGISSRRCENVSLFELLTDHEVNEWVRDTDDASLDPFEIHKHFLEMWNEDRDRIKLEVRRRIVLCSGVPLGVVAMACRVEEFPNFEPKRELDCLEFFSRLSIGEVEVIKLVIDGQLNKSIAKQLGIAMRTVEARRSKAMSKLGVSTVPDLVKLWCSFNNY